MHVQILFKDQSTGKYVHMATMKNNDPLDLKLLWRYTNNVEGSWSQSRFVPDWGYEFTDYDEDGIQVNNWDRHPDMEIVLPLRTHDGRLMGHRSAMIGDQYFDVETQTWHQIECYGFSEHKLEVS